MNFAEKIARPDILTLKPYSSAREDFTGAEGIFLDANENPFNAPLNRYPDPFQKELRTQIAHRKGIDVSNLILGNGSDETIDMLFRTFCRPATDNVVAIDPTYGMYKVCADINGVEYRKVLLNEDFSLPVYSLLQTADENTKMIFVCAPNNPTGNLFAPAAIEQLLRKFKGLVVIDEAYIDFSKADSWSKRLGEFSNLFVLQTFSKAWGMAAIRVGMGMASEDVIRLMMKVKPPYNINDLSQKQALKSLGKADLTQKYIQTIMEERDLLMTDLARIPLVKKVYASDANYFLIKVEEPDMLYAYLVDKGVIVRNRSREPLCGGCLRITTGSPGQNRYLVALVKAFGNPESEAELSPPHGESINLNATGQNLRTAIRRRKTRETDISIRLTLEGSGNSEVETGLGFFNHMIDQIARHSGCDLEVKVNGDLEVDEHHTLEDTAIALGEAFNDALGDKKGLERYGFALPMDDCAALVLLDFGGRPDLVWKAKFKRESIGDLPTEMFSHIFKSFAIGAKCNLYIKAKGKNEHHKIEAIFKAFARAIKMAIRREEGSDVLPSTKGLL